MVECDRCHRKYSSYAALKQHYSDQHPNAKWPEAYEKRIVDEKSVQAYKAKINPGQGSHTKLIIVAILLVAILGGGVFYLPNLFSTAPNLGCAGFPFPTIAGQDLAEHYHADLMIFVNGQQISVPFNVGEGDSGPCTQPLHVHQSSPGTEIIHIESPVIKSYTLGQFFEVWAATPNIGGPTPVIFNQNQIFSNSVGNGNELRMYVNGQQSNAYGSLVLQDHMTIVVVYGNSATDWSHYQTLSGQPWSFPNL